MVQRKSRKVMDDDESFMAPAMRGRSMGKTSTMNTPRGRSAPKKRAGKSRTRSKSRGKASARSKSRKRSSSRRRR